MLNALTNYHTDLQWIHCSKCGGWYHVKTWVNHSVPMLCCLVGATVFLHYHHCTRNEVRCRDDTVPKTVDTRRHCEEEWEHATIFRNPIPTSLVLGGCRIFLHAFTPSRSDFLYIQFLAWCHPYIHPTSILLFIILVSLIFLSRFSLEMQYFGDCKLSV